MSSRSVSSNRHCVKTRRGCTPARISPPATATGMSSKTWRGAVRAVESAVAREAIALAQTAAERLGTNDRSAHVGYYLIDHGRQLAGACSRLPFAVAQCGSAGRAGISVCSFTSAPSCCSRCFRQRSCCLRSAGSRRVTGATGFLLITGIIGVSALAVPLVNLAGHARPAAARVTTPGFFGRNSIRSPHHGGCPHLAEPAAGDR